MNYLFEGTDIYPWISATNERSNAHSEKCRISLRTEIMNARLVASYWMSLCDYRRDISSQAQVGGK